MDKYKIDGHKLTYHVSRLNSWLNGEIIYPVYMEIGPSGTCNHRCTFCALDFMKYQKRFLSTGLFKERLSELGSLGIKSVMYAGEGEPLIHKQITDIIHHTKKSGIDVAISTNGVLLGESLADEILCDVEWIKVSINAGTKETYATIHRTRASDFERVLKNMSHAARLKREKGYSCALGLQLLLLPENRHEVLLLAEIARDIGMDYLVIKPYSQHPLSNTKRYMNVKYGSDLGLADKLHKISGENFNVIFRSQTMQKWDSDIRQYDHCSALPFWSYIDAGGNVWGCSAYLGDDRFHYGNINETSFQEIWEGQKRRKTIHWVENELNADECRLNCRMDKINKYLWEVKHPPEHVNFI